MYVLYVLSTCSVCALHMRSIYSTSRLPVYSISTSTHPQYLFYLTVPIYSMSTHPHSITLSLTPFHLSIPLSMDPSICLLVCLSIRSACLSIYLALPTVSQSAEMRPSGCVEFNPMYESDKRILGCVLCVWVQVVCLFVCLFVWVCVEEEVVGGGYAIGTMIG